MRPSLESALRTALVKSLAQTRIFVWHTKVARHQQGSCGPLYRTGGPKASVKKAK